MPVINGNESDNKLIGDSYVFGAVNYIYGFGGNDTLQGGFFADNYIWGGTGNDQISGGTQINELYGESGNDYIYAFYDSENINLFGGDGDDILVNGSYTGGFRIEGFAGIYMDGGSGADLMIGGEGADTYIVDNAGDRLIETWTPEFDNETNPIDTVLSSVSFALPTEARIEFLTTIDASSSQAINLSGNSLSQTILGNAGDNILAGHGGDDKIISGAGNDTLLGGAGNDVLDGGEGVDIAVFSGFEDDYVVTQNIDGSITVTDLRGPGSDGSDQLIGIERLQFATRPINVAPGIISNGAGTLAHVDINENQVAVTSIRATDPDAGTTLSYAIVGGDDAFQFTIDTASGLLKFNAAPDFEKPTDSDLDNKYEVIVAASDGELQAAQTVLVSVTDVRGKAVNGTSKNDKLVGTAEDDTLNGKAGIDSLTGGSGGDTYVVDNTGDRVVERSGEGIDLVKASVSYTLSSNIENLTLTGSKSINATGNNLANELVGNSAANTLKGGIGNDSIHGSLGADSLYGGTGKDKFIFTALKDSTLKATDTIFDFNGKAGDRIDLAAIDANTRVRGDDSFTFIGKNEFSKKAGELRFDKVSGDTVIYADVNGDGKADFAVDFDQAVTLTKDYFLL
ncbi:Ca2+-binding RTX toxin-like protein [Rhizobium soli]|uniref:Ca2+-binding RTX toxin-like protein n=1 Tax=Rhizobium soli TaxID=424798 RepID=A0A7X0JMQ6_9HYPH|nr:calcium-binding protein [Rhizobium soli]MBB6510418.1 Ca2+-binding RTX toxin-like protein [Rhizobium soli]